ncbi:hypothetical protein ACGFIY_32435 [Micromonospora chersina]|uniref:hypothetical protein n=1 Tax=Micromonospora chersina TaxID=47854 RepID=UPI003710B47C
MQHDIDIFLIPMIRKAWRRLHRDWYVGRLRIEVFHGTLLRVRLLEGSFGLGFVATSRRRIAGARYMVNFFAGPSWSKRGTLLVGLEEAVSTEELANTFRRGSKIYLYSPLNPEIGKAAVGSSGGAWWLLPQGGGAFPEIRGRDYR